MASNTVHLYVNKFSNAEIVAKSVRVLTAIENCRCSHCIELLKEAFQNED